MASLRHERIRELLKRALSEILRREVSTEECGLVTINDVGIAKDLHSAIVYVGILGSDTQRKHGAEFLVKQRGRLEFLCAKDVKLKYTPNYFQGG